jgi:hypothetical protein
MENENKYTLCYRYFNKPKNLYEALDKARRNGNKVKITIWDIKIDSIEYHFGRIKSGWCGSLYFKPISDIGSKEEYHLLYKNKALAAKKWFEKKGIEVKFIDKYKKSSIS